MIRAAIAAITLAVALAGCGGGSSDKVATVANQPIKYSGMYTSDPSADQVHGWIAHWCNAQLGMTPQQVYDIVGEPTDAGSEYMKWIGFNYLLFVQFDLSGKAQHYEVQADDTSAVPCQTIRDQENP